MEEMCDTRYPEADDAIVQAAVLRQLLALHPVQLTLDELVREVAGETCDFAARDEVERAAGELCAAGLAHRNGTVVLPTRAALRFDELFE